MQLMLTSFGVAEEDLEPSQDRSLFYRMPPVSMHTVSNVFMPDYAALILCEKLILDEASFVSLQQNPHWSFTAVADAIELLYHEGFIKLVDFRHILKRNENLLKKMLEHDLKILDQWVEPFRASLDIWRHFAYKSYELLREDRNRIMHSKILPRLHVSELITYELTQIERYGVIPGHCTYYSHIFFLVKEALESSSKRKRAEYREALRQALRSYLSYVNANIVLSNEIGVGFHDWADFLPFYRLKFLSVGKENIKEERQIEESQKLFEVSFPEFAITDTRALIKALQDKRIADLREMVNRAVKGEVTFDQEFARNIFKEVFEIERRTNIYRKIISYVTSPMGFVPWVGTAAQMVIEETVGTPLEKKLKQKYRWFYLVSDLAEESKAE